MLTQFCCWPESLPFLQDALLQLSGVVLWLTQQVESRTKETQNHSTYPDDWQGGHDYLFCLTVSMNFSQDSLDANSSANLTQMLSPDFLKSNPYVDYKEIKAVHPKGNQPWIFIRRTDAEAETPVLWPSDSKSWLAGKDPDAGKDWGQEEKGTTEEEMVGWHHWFNGHEFE